MCLHILRYWFALALIRPFDCLNYLSRNHLFGSNVGVTTEWYEQGGLVSFAHVSGLN